jgi:hypothetical protein
VKSEFPNFSGGTTVSGERIEIFVTDRVHPNDRIRAVLSAVCDLSFTDGKTQYSQQIDLNPYALKNGVLAFQGVFEDVQTFYSVDYRGYGAVNCENSLSVVKNGNWQVDPINGTTAFKFQFAK